MHVPFIDDGQRAPPLLPCLDNMYLSLPPPPRSLTPFNRLVYIAGSICTLRESNMIDHLLQGRLEYHCHHLLSTYNQVLFQQKVSTARVVGMRTNRTDPMCLLWTQPTTSEYFGSHLLAFCRALKCLYPNRGCANGGEP